MPITRRHFLLGGLALASGCTTEPDQPPLDELYRYYTDRDLPPLVLIHGAFGSRLENRRTGEEVWPGSDAKLLLSAYKGLEVDIDEETLEPLVDDIGPSRLFEEGLGRDFYAQVVKTLTGAGRYILRQAGTPVEAGQRNLYIFLYDWRLDNAASVKSLHEFIQRIQHDYQNSAQQVDILAHSNGGMLARYYARYGIEDRLDSDQAVPNYFGAGNIRRLLLVGTPNLGTVQPVLSLIRGEDIGFRKVPSEIVATTTGAPQLMPHPSIPWLVDMDGNIVDLDLFDINTWKQLQWSIFSSRVRNRTRRNKGGGAGGDRYLAVLEQYLEKHLERGRNFMLLMTSDSTEQDIKPYIFGGDCERTLARIVMEDFNDKLVARERHIAIEKPRTGIDYTKIMYDPGDTVVTRPSLLGRCEESPFSRCANIGRMGMAHSTFICEKHQTLTSNINFQDNILHTLFKA